MRFERMTFCSQSRHATAALYFVDLKRVGFEPTMRKLNRFTVCRLKPLSHLFKEVFNVFS